MSSNVHMMPGVLQWANQAKKDMLKELLPTLLLHKLTLALSSRKYLLRLLMAHEDPEQPLLHLRKMRRYQEDLNIQLSVLKEEYLKHLDLRLPPPFLRYHEARIAKYPSQLQLQLPLVPATRSDKALTRVVHMPLHVPLNKHQLLPVELLAWSNLKTQV